jgi:hypothetical protein
MPDEDQVEMEIVVRDQRCKVTAVKARGAWKACGKFLGKELAVGRATTAKQAFEWWKNKAGWQQPDL